MSRQTPLPLPQPACSACFSIFKAILANGKPLPRSTLPEIRPRRNFRDITRFASAWKMPAPIDPKIKAAIQEAYVNSNLSSEELADQFNVSDRSIRGWAKAEAWDAQRKAKNVIDFAQRKSDRPPVRARVNSDDALAIADLVIADLQGEMAQGITAKDKSAVANSLKTWVEYRRKLKPPTVADLVELAIELNVGPDEFLTELRNAWKRKAI